jgi:hypothetical protein
MQCEVMLQHLRPGRWQDRIREFQAELESDGFDTELDELGLRYLAAGVFFDGVKPRDGDVRGTRLRSSRWSNIFSFSR